MSPTLLVARYPHKSNPRAKAWIRRRRSTDRVQGGNDPRLRQTTGLRPPVLIVRAKHPNQHPRRVPLVIVPMPLTRPSLAFAPPKNIKQSAWIAVSAYVAHTAPSSKHRVCRTASIETTTPNLNAFSLSFSPVCNKQPLSSGVEHNFCARKVVAALVEDAASRLEPNEDTSGSGGFTEDGFVSVGGAISAIGVELRRRISHALGGKSLEELVEPHRTDMSGLQVRPTTSSNSGSSSLRCCSVFVCVCVCEREFIPADRFGCLLLVYSAAVSQLFRTTP